MSRIAEKGITPPPDVLRQTDPVLFAWLSNLQLVFPKISTYEETFDLASIPAGTYSTQTFSVIGLDMDDAITVVPPALTSGVYLISSRVSAADIISLVFYNSTGSPVDETAATYKIMACRV
jgi:hypothetical protein